jgi:hypothetical protein
LQRSIRWNLRDAKVSPRAWDDFDLRLLDRLQKAGDGEKAASSHHISSPKKARRAR